MAPYSPLNTPRFWLDYSDGVNSHAMMFRFANISQLETIKDGVAAYLTNLSPVLFLLTVQGARYSAADSPVSLPTIWGDAPTYGSGVMPDVQAPREIRFEGRTVNGVRASWSVYGATPGTPDTYRWSSEIIAEFSNALLQLQSMATDGLLVAVDLAAPQLYTYINVQYNSYWETRRRG